ncbi:DUF1800 family protein [Olleya sp. R77988]|uniref:DUF1800 family protein n=1 Tax=Olleya sp. R77988 TaxID=3093875 RepID=UPI0037C79C28
MTIKEVQHLHWRAGFGLTPKQILAMENKSKHQIVDDLFLKSKPITNVPFNFSMFNMYTKNYIHKNEERQKALSKLNEAQTKNFNISWIKSIVNTEEVLREKMTLFWANHFVCRDRNTKYIYKYNTTLRKHALGDFREFVKAITKEASMINYLNLNQNNKKSPNENFARELLELFTLGEGNYTEKDIKECARAFTGYSHGFNGNFILRKNKHDVNQKVFFNQKGNFDGDEIVDIILSKKQCARYICERIYVHFVNDIPNDNHVEEMTSIFFKDYNIENLMRYLFMSDWFYAKKNIGNKIKSPIDLLVGIYKIVPYRFRDEKEFLKIQRLLDQVLLDPPNVGGWKGGKNWITTNSLMLRVKLPSMLFEKESYTFKTTGSLDKKNLKIVSVKNKYQDKLDVYVDWKTYKKRVKKLKLHNLLDSLILCDINSGTSRYISTFGRRPKKKNLVKIMSLPEYQMC